MSCALPLVANSRGKLVRIALRWRDGRVLGPAKLAHAHKAPRQPLRRDGKVCLHVSRLFACCFWPQKRATRLREHTQREETRTCVQFVQTDKRTIASDFYTVTIEAPLVCVVRQFCAQKLQIVLRNANRRKRVASSSCRKLNLTSRI